MSADMSGGAYAVLQHCQSDTPEFHNLEGLQQAGSTAALETASQAYLEQLAGHVEHCCAVIFPNTVIQSRVCGGRCLETVALQISHPGTENVSRNLRWRQFPIPDKGPVDFYLVHKAKIIHIQLDPKQGRVLSLSGRLTPLHLDKLEGAEHYLWDRSVVIPTEQTFYPYRFAALQSKTVV